MDDRLERRHADEGKIGGHCHALGGGETDADSRKRAGTVGDRDQIQVPERAPRHLQNLAHHRHEGLGVAPFHDCAAPRQHAIAFAQGGRAGRHRRIQAQHSR